MIPFRTFRFPLLSLALILVFAGSAFADGLRGRVSDPDKRPVALADVLILRAGTVVATAKTAADGQFGPLTLAAGEYDVIASAPGLRAQPKRVSVTTTGSVEANFELQLAVVSESLVVSAAQVERPLSRVTDSVTVVDRRDLETRQSETALDALRLVPGFSMISSGGRGALTSVFPRGGESDYTLVVVDGLPMNAFGGGFDAAHLSTAGIDRIEVVRGPQSALFGGGAIGGVVHLSTMSGGPNRGQVVLESGNTGFGRVSGSTAGSWRSWSWGGAFERQQSDGDTSERASLGGRVSNDDYKRALGSFSAGWSDRADRRIRIDARFSQDERGFPGPYGSDPLGLYSGIDTISRGITRDRGVSGSAALGDAQTIRHNIQASWFSAPSVFVSPFGDSDNRTRRLTGRYQADFRHRQMGVSAGMELLRERSDNTFITGTVFQPIPVERTLAGWFAESRFDAGTRGSITAGLRLERIERNAIEADGFGSRPTLAKDVVWSLNPKVSAAWFVRGSRGMDAATGWTRVRVGAGTGIKPPTAFELAFTNNPSLKPERNRSIDAGIEHVFAGALIALDATVFANRFDDLIVSIGTAYSGSSRYRTDNVANARAAGLELGARWHSPGRLLVRGAYTFLDTEVLAVDDAPGAAPFPYSVGDPLIRRAKHQGSLEVRYTDPRLNAFVIVSGRGQMSDLEPNFASSRFPSAGHVVVSGGGTYQIAKSLQAFARVANLFNREYEDALGYPAPGRTGVVGLRVALSR